VPSDSGGAKPPGKDSVTERGGELRQAAELDAKQGSGAATSSEGDTFRTQTGAKARELARRVVEAAGGSPDSYFPDQAVAPSRAVGAKGAAPHEFTVALRLQGAFMDPTAFGAVPVKIDAALQERDGRQIWARKGDVAGTFEGLVRTSEPSLHMNVWYTYELNWPFPTRVQTNAFATLQPRSDSRLEATLRAMVEVRILSFPGNVMPDDGVLTAIVQAAGIQLRQVLGRPDVMPRPEGGFTVQARVLGNVVLEQTSA
jgi:hypothetical protein